MNLNRTLMVVALVLMIIATLLGFDVFRTTGDPHVLGWVAAGLAFYLASLVLPPKPAVNASPDG